MTRKNVIESIESVLQLTHEKSITVTIPRLTAELAVFMLKDQEDLYQYIKNGCLNVNIEQLNNSPEKQKALEPEVEVLNEINRFYRCPKCHRYFFYEKQKYCDRCGQEVKWT